MSPPPGERRPLRARGRPGARDLPAVRAWRLAGWGTLVLGGPLAGLSAASGGGGRDGMRFLLLGALLACAVGALYAVVTGALDTLRGRPVGRSRIAAAAVLGLLALLLPAMLVALGG